MAFKTCLAEAEPEAFIGIPKAHAARVALGWAKPTLRTLVTVGRRWFWGGRSLADVRSADASEYLAKTRPEETAAILFTSG
ncbi:MAG: peptide synthase, partial [Rhodospirillaceae bacterium]